MEEKEKTTTLMGWIKATRQLLNMFCKEDYDLGRSLTEVAILTTSLHLHGTLHLQSAVQTITN